MKKRLSKDSRFYLIFINAFYGFALVILIGCYRKTVILEVTPTENLSLEGGSVLTVRARAIAGSNVTATFNGKTVTLVENGKKEDALSKIDVVIELMEQIPKSFSFRVENLL